MTKEQKDKILKALAESACNRILEQEPCEVSEYDKDHIWYKGHQYISLRRFLEVKAEAEQEPCEDEYIKVPKKALKYRTAGMVAYNAEWLKNHFDIERAVIMGCEYKEQEPCEDAISREAVRHILNHEIKMPIKVWKKLYELVDDLPPVNSQPKTGWIPVNERLPEENMACLVAVGKFNLIKMAMYSDLMGTIDHRIFYQGLCGDENFEDITQYVKAWMPLPKPYKAESEEV